MTYSMQVGKYKLMFSDTHFKDFCKKPTVSVYDAERNSEIKIASFVNQDTFEWFIEEVAEQTEQIDDEEQFCREHKCTYYRPQEGGCTKNVGGCPFDTEPSDDVGAVWCDNCTMEELTEPTTEDCSMVEDENLGVPYVEVNGKDTDCPWK